MPLQTTVRSQVPCADRRAPIGPRSAGESVAAAPAASGPGRHVLTGWLDRKFPGVFVHLAELGGKPKRSRWSGVTGAARFMGARAAAILRTWRERERTRAALRWMSDVELRDLGLSRSQIIQELNKPFWRN